MKNLFEILKEIKESEFASVVSFAKMDEKNEKFVDYEYFTIEFDNMYFYIEDSKTNFTGRTITPYIKIDYNHKEQADYPIEFYTFEDLQKIVLEQTKKREGQKNGFGPKQRLNFDFDIYHETGFGKITLFRYLQKIAGYREKEILQNIDKITMNLNNDKYLVYELYNKQGQSFAINCKNLDRLIIS